MPRPEDSVSLNEYSLFDYYPLETKQEFLREQLRLGASDKGLLSYLKSSVYSTLGEFAGHVKSDMIGYYLDGGHIYYPGVAEPIDTNLKSRATDTGPGSREWADSEGMQKILNSFLSDEANLAFWVSPPSFGVEGFGDYGFVFVMLKNPDGQVEERILRYERETGDFRQSFGFFSDIFPDSLDAAKTPGEFYLRNEKDFLSRPILLNREDPYAFLEKKLNQWGYPVSAEANGFMGKIKADEDISRWLDYFCLSMLEWADNPGQNTQLSAQARTYMTAIYNRACRLKEPGDTVSVAESYGDSLPAFGNPVGGSEVGEREKLIYYASQKPVVQGGGSCPGEKNTRGEPGSSWDLFDRGLRDNGGFPGSDTALNTSENRKTEGNKRVTCPGCRNEVVFQAEQAVAAGRLECPHCHLSVDNKCDVEAIAAAAHTL